ncbi:MAG: type II toxin-antitoxin system VapC family toxin [Candidatus Omnitrophica bacterium]|nr:type II toxin-antitoxin system VapC family toxin [Candidatus Omnitrophota bacterium]
MIHLLDTNVCVALLRGFRKSVVRELSQLNQSEVALCSVVKAELYYGALASANPERSLEILREFYSGFLCFPFDDSAAEAYGPLRKVLSQTGKLIGPNDLLIAAIALCRGATLVTHNTGEFSRIPGLHIVDWEAD